jgi:hypothetical protein
MKQKADIKKPSVWLVMVLCALIVFLGIGNHLGVLGDLHFKLGPYFSHHWMSWAGAAFIAVYLPIHHYLRVRNPRRYFTLLKFHIYGNLTALAFITVHFSQHVSRPSEFYPDLGTGVALYATAFLLVFTGILLSFGFLRTRRPWWRYIHTSLASAFYVVIVIHVLHGLEVI